MDKLGRAIAEAEHQNVPNQTGWVFITGNQDNSFLSKVEYMSDTNDPVTEYSTVQEVLKMLQVVTKK